MSYHGLVLAACALFLAALARPAGVAEPARAQQPACRFTLEQSGQPAAEDQAETWVLTCHRGVETAVPMAHAAPVRRVTAPRLEAGS